MVLKPRAMGPANVANVPAHQAVAATATAHAQGRGSTVTAPAPTQEIASMNVTAARGTVARRSVVVSVTVTTSAHTAGRGSTIEHGRETESVKETEKGEALAVLYVQALVVRNFKREELCLDIGKTEMLDSDAFYKK